MKKITKEELKKELQNDEDVQLVDVRTPEEFHEGTIDDAVLAPHTLIVQELEKFPDKDKKYVLFCQTERRSWLASRVMEEMGYSNVNYLEGGYSQWK